MLILSVGQKISRGEILDRLIDMTYERNDLDFHRGTFRVHGDTIDIILASENPMVLKLNYLAMKLIVFAYLTH